MMMRRQDMSGNPPVLLQSLANICEAFTRIGHGTHLGSVVNDDITIVVLLSTRTRDVDGHHIAEKTHPRS